MLFSGTEFRFLKDARTGGPAQPAHRRPAATGKSQYDPPPANQRLTGPRPVIAWRMPRLGAGRRRALMAVIIPGGKGPT
jgi:hypothetical protein